MTPEDIKTHLAAGRYYGRQATCGIKVKWTTFDKADKEADRLYRSNPKKNFEAYPCYFCSPDIEHEIYVWHVGRAMTTEEWLIFYDAAGKLLEMEDVTVTGGQQLRVHNRRMCQGQFCCVHNPSDHHMTTWPMNWSTDSSKMERKCPHGIGHPDPDDIAFHLRAFGEAYTTHGCDGCCAAR